MTSFGFIGSLFSYYWGGSKSALDRHTDPIEEELRMLMDATVLSSPQLLKEGFDLYMQKPLNDARIGENISHLSELDLHTLYITQKGTKVIRSSQFEVTLGDEAIFIPILKRGETYETTRNLSQLCMKGQLFPESLVVAVENFSGSRIKDQGALFYENGNSRRVFVSEDFTNLEPGVTYVAPHGGMLLRRLPQSSRIDFSFGRNLCKPAAQAARKPKNLEISTPNPSIHCNNAVNIITTSRSARKRARRRPGALPSLNSIQSPPASPRTIVARQQVKKRTYNVIDSPMNSPGESRIPSEFSDTKRHKFCRDPENTTLKLSDENLDTSNSIISNIPSIISNIPLIISDIPSDTTPTDSNIRLSELNIQLTDSNIPLPPAGLPPPPSNIPPPPMNMPPPPMNMPPPPKSLSGLSLSLSSRNAVTPATRRRRLRPLHWKAIPKNKLQSTFWSKLDDIELKEENLELSLDLESVFSISPDKNEKTLKTSTTFEAKLAAKQKINILDVKKSNNIGILLAQFKMTFSNIKQSLLEMDNLLTTEHLISLKYMFPLTEEERGLFEVFDGDPESLTNADQFYLELLPIPRLEQKINFFLFKRLFDEQIDALNESAMVLTSACEELQSSTQFAKILKLIFTIGTCLNRDTRLSESAGFSLESLPKIIETKAGNGNLTFIDFLVTKVEKSDSELLHFEEDLPHLEHASKLSIEILSNHRKETETEISELRREISFYEKDSSHFSEHDKFLEVMKPFVTSAEQKFEIVSSVLTSAIATFNSVVEYFGDDKKTSPETFFKNIVTFAHAFRRSHHQRIEKQKRAEILRIKELKRQEKEAQLRLAATMQTLIIDSENEVDETEIQPISRSPKKVSVPKLLRRNSENLNIQSEESNKTQPVLALSQSVNTLSQSVNTLSDGSRERTRKMSEGARGVSHSVLSKYRERASKENNAPLKT